MGSRIEAELNVGDELQLRHGPFLSTWKVVELIRSGARLEWVEGAGIRFVGYPTPQVSESGIDLTTNAGQEFIGRAHFAAHSRKGPPWVPAS